MTGSPLLTSRFRIIFRCNQVKRFDRTFFHFGDLRKLIFGFFRVCRFYFVLEKMFKIDAQKPPNL